MYTRVTTGRYDTAREKDAQRMAETTVLDAARKLSGFKSYNAGMDRKGAGSQSSQPGRRKNRLAVFVTNSVTTS